MITLHVAKANKSRRELKCLSYTEYSTQGQSKAIELSD